MPPQLKRMIVEYKRVLWATATSLNRFMSGVTASDNGDVSDTESRIENNDDGINASECICDPNAIVPEQVDIHGGWRGANWIQTAPDTSMISISMSFDTDSDYEPDSDSEPDSA
jgi:hypothetical protein